MFWWYYLIFREVLLFHGYNSAVIIWKDVGYRGLVQKHPSHHPVLVCCLDCCSLYWKTRTGWFQESHAVSRAGLKQISCKFILSLFTCVCWSSWYMLLLCSGCGQLVSRWLARLTEQACAVWQPMRGRDAGGCDFRMLSKMLFNLATLKKGADIPIISSKMYFNY